MAGRSPNVSGRLTGSRAASQQMGSIAEPTHAEIEETAEIAEIEEIEESVDEDRVQR
jgi:hypothetical protein